MSSEQSSNRIGKSVGERLRAARIAHNYTQGQLAAPDFSISYISAIERGQIHPSLRALEILAARLGIASAQLLPQRSAIAIRPAPPQVMEEHEENIDNLTLLEAQLAIHAHNEQNACTLLENLLKEPLQPAQRLRPLYLLGWAYLKSERPHEAEQRFNEAIQAAKEANASYFIPRILALLGTTYSAMYNYAQAIITHKQCLTLLAAMTPPDVYLQAQVSLALGQHYLAQGHSQQAEEQFHSTLATLHQLENIQQYYIEQGQAFLQAQVYDLAQLTSYKSLFLSNTQTLAKHRSQLYYQLGIVSLLQGETTSNAYLDEALKRAISEQDALSIASISLYKVKVYLAQQLVGEATAYLQKALTLVQGQEDSFIHAETLLTAGQVAYEQHDNEGGDEYFRAGLVMLERIGNTEKFAEQAVRYAHLLEQHGKMQEALHYFKRAFQSNQQL